MVAESYSLCKSTPPPFLLLLLLLLNYLNWIRGRKLMNSLILMKSETISDAADK
jgi:hypothetical protein